MYVNERDKISIFFAIVFFQNYENSKIMRKQNWYCYFMVSSPNLNYRSKQKNIRLKLRCFAAANSMKSVKNIKNLVIGNTITSKTILTNVFFASNKCTTTTVPMCPDKSLNRAFYGHKDAVMYLLGTIHPYI